MAVVAAGLVCSLSLLRSYEGTEKKDSPTWLFDRQGVSIGGWVAEQQIILNHTGLHVRHMALDNVLEDGEKKDHLWWRRKLQSLGSSLKFFFQLDLMHLYFSALFLLLTSWGVVEILANSAV